MLTTSRYNKGKEGERVAAEYLSKRGLKILEQNFRCPAGEIDLIAKDAKTLVFVEVRSKQPGGLCSPEESITVHKMKRIMKAALWYLKQAGAADSYMRFDVVAIRWGGEKPEINWIVNAFEAR